MNHSSQALARIQPSQTTAMTDRASRVHRVRNNPVPCNNRNQSLSQPRLNNLP